MLTRNEGQTLSGMLIVPAIWVGRPVEPSILPDILAVGIAAFAVVSFVYFSVTPPYRNRRRARKRDNR